MSKLLTIMMAIVLSACSTPKDAATFDTQTIKPLDKPLHRNESVAVEVPENGRFKNTIYQDSGQKTAAAFKSEFDRYAASTMLIASCSGKACIEDAARNGAGYVLSIEIVHWEERQTAWSGIRDRITVKVALFDVADGRELNAAYLQGNGPWDISGGHVDDLLISIVPPYVSSLY